MGINGFPFFVTLCVEEFTLGSHSYSNLILQLIVYPAMSHFLKLIIIAASGVRRNFLRWGAHPGFGKGAPPASNKFLRFSHKKTLILAHFFVEKGHAVSAVTIDIANIFSQLMSKSRSLAKISEKVGFSTLLQGQRGGGMVPSPCPACTYDA